MCSVLKALQNYELVNIIPYLPEDKKHEIYSIMDINKIFNVLHFWSFVLLVIHSILERQPLVQKAFYGFFDPITSEHNKLEV